MEQNENLLLLDIGNKLKKLRKDKKLTLEKACELSGKPYQEISEIERGKKNITVATLQTLTNLYEVDPIIKFRKRTTQRQA